MKLILIYPDIPFWRIKIIRLVLFIGGTDFEDSVPTRE